MGDSVGYGDYFGFLDSMGGWWNKAWYSTLAVTLGVAIWAETGKVILYDTPYAHQASCACGPQLSAPVPTKKFCVHSADGPLSMSYWGPARRAERGLWLCWTQ